MAKLNVTRLLDISKVLTTDVGQEIPDFFNYMANFVEQVVRNLRIGLTFADNFNCDTKTVSLKHATPQVVSTSKSPVQECFVTRSVSSSNLVTGFGWYYDNSGNFTVCAHFASVSDPTVHPTTAIDVNLVINF